MITCVFIFTAILLAVITFIPVSGNTSWVVRVWDFPRLQILLLCTLNVFLSVVFLDSFAELFVVIISLICVAYQLVWIIPYTVIGKKQVKEIKDSDGFPGLSILVINVLMTNKKYMPLLELINKEKPDILVLLETNLWWEQKLSPLDEVFPYSLKCPKENLYGMHVYSRMILSDAEIQYLVDKEIPSMHMIVHMPEGQRIRLHCLHPVPPSPTESDESTDRDSELLMVGKSVADSELPVILAGDLNDVAWSATTRLFMKISGLLDPRRGRGFFSTFHSHYFFLRWPLDHVFHSQHFLLKSLRCLPDMGSDHFPVMAELVYAPAHGMQQESLEKEKSDEVLAPKKMDMTDSTAEDVHTPGGQKKS
ncbi:endonuclease/exonuclease/phosphatase family protein [Escherichia coli]|nr:endonuclease/exonuclease/phosphatase family protein [Escherichia coli]MBF5530641.1 endonuclease [Escherichia coli]HAU9417530.1 endonuclease [Escherichia coli]